MNEPLTAVSSAREIAQRKKKNQSQIQHHKSLLQENTAKQKDEGRNKCSIKTKPVYLFAIKKNNMEAMSLKRRTPLLYFRNGLFIYHQNWI